MRQKRVMAALLAAMMLVTASCGMGQGASEAGSSRKEEVQEEEKDTREEEKVNRGKIEDQSTTDRKDQETSVAENETDAGDDQDTQASESQDNSTQDGNEEKPEEPAEPVDSEEADSEEEGQANNLVDGMRPEFKEAMDSYEAFYDEYCEFMKQYNENPSDLKLLAKYADFMTKLVDVNEKFEAWDGDTLNDAELKYYIEVNGRVTQKLLDAAVSM